MLPNGDLVSDYIDDSIKIWNLEDGTIKNEIAVKCAVRSLISHADGNVLCGFANGKIKIFSSELILVNKIKASLMGIYSLASFANGDFASASNDYRIKIWSEDGELKDTIYLKSDVISKLVATQNGDIACGCDDDTLKIWSHDGSLKHNLNVCVCALDVLSNGDLISCTFSLRGEGTVIIWDSENGQLKFNLSIEFGSISMIKALPNEEIVVAFDDGKILITNANCKGLCNIYPLSDVKIIDIVVLPNGDFAWALQNGFVQISNS